MIILPILNFWRESKSYGDNSVPEWLLVGGSFLFPPLEPGVPIHSIVDKMPAISYTDPNLFPTIERGGGYVSLKVGQYKMKHSKKIRGAGTINCLQCMDAEIDQILIHDALNDSSTTLQGCIAPGMSKKASPGMGILDSATAMTEIFKLLGGYSIGKGVILNVWSNVPGETRTRASWDRIKAG